MLKLEEIRNNLITGEYYYRTTESRFGDYIEIFEKGSINPVAYITLNKGDDTNNTKVRRDLMDIEAERRYKMEWDDHLPLIEKFVSQLKDAGFTVGYKSNRANVGVIVYANELKISMNFEFLDRNLFNRNAIIYVNGEALWHSINSDTDYIIKLLTTGNSYLHNLIADQKRSSEDSARWFKQLDLSDD